jgi:Holliday junction resolvase RusA-like endonuclease
MLISFEVEGQPFGKQRPRMTKRGHTYTPAETSVRAALIANEAEKHFDAPISGPIRVDVIAVFKPAKSWSAKKTREALGRPHTQKPDKDNVEKLVLDALNGIAYPDDSQVWDGGTRKVWGAVAKTVVTVSQEPNFAPISLEVEGVIS